MEAVKTVYYGAILEHQSKKVNYTNLHYWIDNIIPYT